MTGKKKIAILRTLGVRIPHVEFAKSFKKFDPYLIGDLNKEVISYSRKLKVKYCDIPLKPACLIDPVKLILGRTVHQSWVGPDPKILDSVLKNIDIYQIYESYFFYSRYSANIAQKYNKPLVTEVWVCYPKHPSKYIPPYSINVRTVMNKTDFFIARSNSALNYLKEFRIPEKKISVIYQGLNLKRFYPRKNKREDSVKILFVGALIDIKGIDDILAVFPKLVRESKKKVELLVCGSGKLSTQVVAMSKSLPIKYFGEVPNNEIQKIYRMADIFCGPSKTLYTMGIKRIEEGFGLVFQEALASGLPIVTNRCGGVPEVVGHNNILNKQGNKIALLKSLLKLVDDSKTRTEIGLKNRKRAEKLFNLEKQTSLTEKEIIRRFF
jgi:glycosyltransferase involved in cell wall biosynthesis